MIVVPLRLVALRRTSITASLRPIPIRIYSNRQKAQTRVIQHDELTSRKPEMSI